MEVTHPDNNTHGTIMTKAVALMYRDWPCWRRRGRWKRHNNLVLQEMTFSVSNWHAAMKQLPRYLAFDQENAWAPMRMAGRHFLPADWGWAGVLGLG